MIRRVPWSGLSLKVMSFLVAGAAAVAQSSPAGAQEIPAADEVLASFRELEHSESALEAEFMSTDQIIQDAREKHAIQRDHFTVACSGRPGMGRPSSLADIRLRELESAHERLRVRRKELEARRRQLERERTLLEGEAALRGHGTWYLRGLHAWIERYRADYLEPFAREVVGGGEVYAKGVLTHASGLAVVTESCQQENPPSSPGVSYFSQVVELIGVLQRLIVGTGKTA